VVRIFSKSDFPSSSFYVEKKDRVSKTNKNKKRESSHSIKKVYEPLNEEFMKELELNSKLLLL